MADSESPTREKTPRSSLDSVSELIKALVWPVLSVLFLLCFWTPLHKVVAAVPAMLVTTEDVSIGGWHVHLRKTLVDQAPADIKTTLGDLGPEEVRLILEVRPSDIVCFKDTPSAAERRPYESLVKLGLFAWATKDETKQQQSEGYPCGYGVSTTSRFIQTRDFLIAAISELVQQSKAEPDTRSTTLKGEDLRSRSKE